MKRIIKGILIIICLFTINVYALEKEYNDVSVDSKYDITLDKFTVKDVTFTKYDDSFGLLGEINNEYTSKMDMEINISFFDKSGYLITNQTIKRTLNNGKANFNLIFDSKVLNNYKISDISKYTMTVIVLENKDIIDESLYPSLNSAYKKYDYVIDTAKIEITVNKNKTYDVVETLNVYFNKSLSSFDREIPLKKYTITDYKVKDYESTTSLDNNVYKTKTNINAKADETKVITVSYKVVMDEDQTDFDYDVIPKWNTAIANLMFGISFPKETVLDEVKLIFEGNVSKFNNNNKDYIYGIIKDGFVNKNVNVTLDLPDNYFSSSKKLETTTHILKYLLIPVGAAVIIGGVIFIVSRSKSKEKIETL